MRFLSAALARLHVDAYIVAILAVAGIATVFPAQGSAAAVLDRLATIAITTLFFLYGAKLPTAQAFASLRDWRLHTVIALVTFGIFPVLALMCWLLVPQMLDTSLYGGVAFLCALPSTVQSSITLTSMAKGNEAAAICSASVSSLLGVVLTPFLVALLISTEGGFSLDSLRDIASRLLLPFLAGQVAQRWIGDLLRAHGRRLALYDRSVILLAIYIAFSQGVVNGIWHRLEPARLVLLMLVVTVLLAIALGCTGLLSRALGFTQGDHIAIVFCGSQKSLATGLPMATVLFPGGALSLMVLPLMLYHQLQLLVCSWLARRFAAGSTPRVLAPARRRRRQAVAAPPPAEL